MDDRRECFSCSRLFKPKQDYHNLCYSCWLERVTKSEYLEDRYKLRAILSQLAELLDTQMGVPWGTTHAELFKRYKHGVRSADIEELCERIELVNKWLSCRTDVEHEWRDELDYEYERLVIRDDARERVVAV